MHGSRSIVGDCDYHKCSGCLEWLELFPSILERILLQMEERHELMCVQTEMDKTFVSSNFLRGEEDQNPTPIYMFYLS